MSGVFFRTERLTVSFGGLAALSNLDLEIQEGEIVGLIGPNGAGKTTAFNAITGIVKPSRGRIVFLDADITGWRTPRIARSGIARTFQNIRLYEDLTVTENVMVAAHCSVRYSVVEAISGLGRFRSDERRIHERAQFLLDLMGLTRFAREKAGSLPYGSQRKLEIARGLALNPQLLLLDEPVAGMNPHETMEFCELVRTIRTELGLTVGLIDHDMGFVMDVCHKIKVIDHGIPIAWGTPQEIQNDPKVIAAYLGETSA
ncbi:MAG TPA: ABC transporter ATP-binding protein [Desulfomonilaceae bacterium]|nr:ABC transporter ATP-binding protein [Desulfomonilaceae bacterium]